MRAQVLQATQTSFEAVSDSEFSAVGAGRLTTIVA